MARETPATIARRQHGLVTREQALRAGVTAKVVQGLLDRGHWERVHRGVYRVAGTPRTSLQRLLAAVLAAGEGAMASHRSAAWLWGLADEVAYDVTVHGHRRPRVGGDVRVHRRDLTRERAVIRQGVPCTNPLRTVLDLAAGAGAGVVETAVDRGVARRLFTPTALEAEVARAARRGRKGVAVLRACLERRAGDGGRPASVLESRLARLVRQARLPVPVREHPVAGGYRVDFAWPEAGVAVELDGYEHHSSWDDFRRDRARQNELVLAGWVVLRFTWRDVEERPAWVVSLVGEAVRSASRPA